MFEKLKHRWQVNGFNLLLIICTFALGGSLCGLAGRKLLSLTEMEKGTLWALFYIILITDYASLALLRFTDQYPTWAIFIFHKIFN